MARLFYQGHSSFRITSDAGKVCFIDPFAGVGYQTPADLVLITHEHYDHNAIDKITMAPGCVVIRSKDAINGGIYREFAEKGYKIKAVPAYNSHHPRGFGCGYLIEIDGVKIYHAGDTDFIPEMASLKSEKIDYALLPIDGFYTMSPEDADRAAEAIAPLHFIPMHMKPGMDFVMAQAMKVHSPRAMLMRPNDEITLEKGF